MHERGAILKKIRGRGETRLILGLEILPELSQSQFKAILAYGYSFSISRHTLTGIFAHQVQEAIYQIVQRLERNGLARWFNPAWLFINGYYRVFLRITRGASRLQSILADRCAAEAYNAHDLTDGLLHTLKRRLIFDMNVPEEVKWARQQGRSLQNIYKGLNVRDQAQKEVLELKLSEILKRPASPYDATPTPGDRISFLEQFKPGRFAEQNSPLVLDLLPNLGELQTKMVAIINASY